jgi:hypothetical protein
MKLRAQGAGSVFRPSRRRLLAGAGVGCLQLLVAGCAASPVPRESLRSSTGGLVAPLRSITGAQLILHTTQTGMPSQKASFGALTPLIFPVAVAASPLDIFIADAGAGRLYRFDPTLNAMAVIVAARVTLQTRLAAGSDGSILVATPQAGFPVRFDRAGTPIQQINANTGSFRYDDVAIDPVSGRVYGLDRTQQRIDEVHPVGRTGIVLTDRQTPANPVGLAMDRRVVYVSSRACGCVLMIDPMSGQQMPVIENLKDIGPLAAGGGWLVVADNMQRILVIFRDGMLRGEPSFQELKLADPQSMALTGNILYVADGNGRRVVLFRLSP